MNKQLLSKTGLILAVILFIAFIIVVNGNFKSARVDLTEDKLYTLSEGGLSNTVCNRFQSKEKQIRYSSA